MTPEVEIPYGQYWSTPFCKWQGAFQRRFMTLPFEVPDARFRHTGATLEGDEGVYPSTAGKLQALEPVLADGSVTFAAQTHPADGNAGLVLVGGGYGLFYGCAAGDSAMAVVLEVSDRR